MYTVTSAAYRPPFPFNDDWKLSLAIALIPQSPSNPREIIIPSIFSNFNWIAIRNSWLRSFVQFPSCSFPCPCHDKFTYCTTAYHFSMHHWIISDWEQQGSKRTQCNGIIITPQACPWFNKAAKNNWTKWKWTETELEKILWKEERIYFGNSLTHSSVKPGGSDGEKTVFFLFQISPSSSISTTGACIQSYRLAEEEIKYNSSFSSSSYSHTLFATTAKDTSTHPSKQGYMK